MFEQTDEASVGLCRTIDALTFDLNALIRMVESMQPLAEARINLSLSPIEAHAIIAACAIELRNEFRNADGTPTVPSRDREVYFLNRLFHMIDRIHGGK